MGHALISSFSGGGESLISSQAISDEAVGVCCNVKSTARLAFDAEIFLALVNRVR